MICPMSHRMYWLDMSREGGGQTLRAAPATEEDGKDPERHYCGWYLCWKRTEDYGWKVQTQSPLQA